MRYRWTILAAGVVAQASFSAILLGLPAITPAIRHGYGLTLPQVGVVLAALNFGLVLTLLPWGLVADRIGERTVLAAGLSGCAVALVAAGRTSSYGGLVAALAVAGALGGGVQSASGRAVMSWFAPHERGLALGIRQTAVPVGGAIAARGAPGARGACEPALGVRRPGRRLRDRCVDGCDPAPAGEGRGCGSGPGRPAAQGRPGVAALRRQHVLRDDQIALVGFLVLFLHDERHLSSGLAAAALAAIQVLGGVARIATGRWSDSSGRRIEPLRIVALLLAAAMAAAAMLLHVTLFVLVPVLVTAGTFALSWNGLSYTAVAEMAGRSRSGSAIGLQQTFLSASSIAAPIAFAAVVHHTSWRVGFWLAAASPLIGYALLSPLAERRP